jgi:hypothetical protein
VRVAEIKVKGKDAKKGAGRKLKTCNWEFVTGHLAAISMAADLDRRPAWIIVVSDE